MTAADNGGKSARATRRGGFRHAGEPLRRGLAPAAARKGFAEPDVLLRWREIAGEELARLCHPVKVTYAKGAALGATLIVAAEGAVALEAEYLAPRIVERINAHYGYRAVSRLKVTQATGLRGQMQGFAETQASFDASPERPYRGEPRPPAPVAPEAAARAEELARDIHHPKLRAALAEMGGFVLSRPRRPKEGGPERP